MSEQAAGKPRQQDPAAGQHCPGCRDYTRDWTEKCPGTPVPAVLAVPGWRPLGMTGHLVGSAADGSPLPGFLCHCRIGRPHRENEIGP